MFIYELYNYVSYCLYNFSLYLPPDFSLRNYFIMLSHYDVLGVEPEASASELKKCYQQLLLRLHPDKAPGKATQFNRLQEAWTVLVDPHQRAEYDKQLKREQVSGAMISNMISNITPISEQNIISNSNGNRLVA